MSDIKIGYDPKLEADYKKALEEFVKGLAQGRLPTKPPPEHNSCVICFRTIPKGATVCSEACKEQLIKQRKYHQEVMRKQQEWFEKLKYEIEQNIRPTTKTVTVTVTGLKKDIEKFEDDIRQIAKTYNLEPWKRVKSHARVKPTEVAKTR